MNGFTSGRLNCRATHPTSQPLPSDSNFASVSIAYFYIHHSRIREFSNKSNLQPFTFSRESFMVNGGGEAGKSRLGGGGGRSEVRASQTRSLRRSPSQPPASHRLTIVDPSGIARWLRYWLREQPAPADLLTIFF